MLEQSIRYPLTVRNRIPLIYRGFMTVFIIGVAVMTVLVVVEPPDYPPWVRVAVIAFFWLGGLGGLAWTLNLEVGRLTIAAPGRLTIVGGPAFRRRRREGRSVQFALEETEDSDGDPYFLLRATIPGDPPLVIAEGHYREILETTRERLELALAGKR